MATPLAPDGQSRRAEPRSRHRRAAVRRDGDPPHAHLGRSAGARRPWRGGQRPDIPQGIGHTGRARPGTPETTIQLAPGDLVVAFTDGVTDAMSAARIRFGDDRLQAALGAVAAGGPQVAVDGVLAAIDEFAKGDPAADDITLLAIGRLAG